MGPGLHGDIVGKVGDGVRVEGVVGVVCVGVGE
jgi:hypothetical protein